MAYQYLRIRDILVLLSTDGTNDHGVRIFGGAFQGYDLEMPDFDGSYNQDIQRNRGHRECKVEDLSQTVEA